MTEASEIFIPHQALFYTGSIQTDAQGRARILIPAGLPAGRHHLQIASQSRDGYFGNVLEDMTLVEDFTVLADMPKFAFAQDAFEIPVSVRNHTDAIMLADVVLEIGGEHISRPIILNIGHTERVHIPLKILSEWRGNMPYTLTLRKGQDVLHRVDGQIWIEEIPYLGLNKKRFQLLRESQEMALSSDEFLDIASSRVRIRLGNTPSILIPGLLEETENAKKTAPSEVLESLIIRAYALRSGIISEHTTEAILQEEIMRFLQPIQREGLQRARLSDREMIAFLA